MFLKSLSDANRDFSAAALYITLIGAFPTSLTFLFWNIYIIKRIQLNLRLYKRALDESKYDSTGYTQSQAYEYRTDFVKYWYMLLVNCAELIGSVFYVFGFAITEFLWNDHKRFAIPNNFLSSNCSLDLYNNLPLELVTEVPIGLACVAFAESGLLFGMAFSVCLMKYLESRYLNAIVPRNWNIRFIQLTCLISILFLIIGSVPQTVILHRIIEPLVQLTYFSIWVRQARRFYKVTKSRALEYRSINNRCYELNLNSAYQFKLVTIFNGFWFGCLIISELFSYTLFFISTILYYSPCLFHYLYGIKLFHPILNTPLELDRYKGFLYTAAILLKIVILLSAIALSGLFFIVSLVYFVRTVLRRRVRTRFTPSITQPFLFTHEVNGADSVEH